MSLNEALKALNARGLAQLPPAAVAIMQKDLADLMASHLAEQAVQAGQRFPPFELPNALGRTVSLQSLLVQGPVVVSFYRGSWCPYCNLELRAHQAMLPALHQLGARLVAISPERPDHSLSLKEKLALDFDVLTDHENLFAKQLGLVFQLSPEMAQLYQQILKISIAEHHGSQLSELPIPASYVIAPSGKVILAHIQADYTQRLEPEAILDSLRQLSSREAPFRLC